MSLFFLHNPPRDNSRLKATMLLKFLPWLVSSVIAQAVDLADIDPKTLDPKRFLTIADGLHARLKYLDPAGSWSGTGGWDYNNILLKVQNYGCYCFIDAQFGAPAIGGLEGNKGEPVDEMDKLCLNLYRCHRCIYDFDHPNQGCSVESKYKSYFDDPTGEFICLKKQTDCQRAQCECDRDFVYKMADLWTNNRDVTWNFDKYYWKNHRKNKKPTFAYKTTCVSKGNAISNSADACCGLPGEKKPFNSANAECCFDGRLAAIGTC